MKKNLSRAMQGTLWMITYEIFLSLMSVLVRIAAEKQGISAWKTSEIRFLNGNQRLTGNDLFSRINGQCAHSWGA